MNFRQAKNVIRDALRGATDDKLYELLDAARAGEVCFCDWGYCFAARLTGKPGGVADRAWWLLSDAYFDLDPVDCYEDDNDDRRHRVLIPMILAEVRRRNRARAAASAVVDEAVRVDALPAGQPCRNPIPQEHGKNG